MAKSNLKGTVSFLLRKDKVNSEGKAPLMLSYSLFGQRQRLSLERNFKKDVKIQPYLFDSKNNQAIYYKRDDAKKVDRNSGEAFDYDRQFLLKTEVDDYNAKLAELMRIVKDCEEYFEANKMKYSSEDIIKALKVRLSGEQLAIKEEKKHYLTEYIKDHLSITEATANRNTLKAQKTMLNHLCEFEKAKKQHTEIEGVDRRYMQSFFNWLVGKGHINGTAQTQIVKLKAFLNLARKDGFKIDLTFKDFTIKASQLEVIALTYDEFTRLKDLDLSGGGYVKVFYGGEWVQASHKTLDKARDLFVFGCLTGLRYSDLNNLKHQNIKDGYISLTVVKTKQKLDVPLIGMAYDIIEKHQTALRPLPVLSNQKLNLYIKEVAKLAGIDEPTEIIRFNGAKERRTVHPKYELVSAHTARKTYITVSLELGMSTEEVMSISGHSSYKSFKRYVNVTKDRAKKAMAKAWNQPTLKVVNRGGE